jgi:hypothetical protein
MDRVVEFASTAAAFWQHHALAASSSISSCSVVMVVPLVLFDVAPGFVVISNTRAGICCISATFYVASFCLAISSPFSSPFFFSGGVN